MKSFLKMVQDERKAVPVAESAADVSYSLRDALHIKCENEGYTNRLRDSEVKTILNYKEQTSRRKIVDFTSTHEAL